MRVLLSALAVFVALAVGSITHAQADAPRAILLMAAQSEQGTVVSFGRDAQDAGPIARTLQAPFEKAGVAFVSAANVAPVVGGAPEGLPLGDTAAVTMARSAGAGIAVVVGLVATSQGGIRATTLVGQSVAVRVRVLDVGAGRAIFDSTGHNAAYGPEATQARSQGSARAIAKATQGLLGILLQHWPAQELAQGRLSLVISGAEGWRPVATILRSLSATRGVSALHALEIRPDQVRLTLKSDQGLAQVVASLRRARIHNGSLAVQTTGNSISVDIVMTPEPILPPVNNG